MKTFLFFTLSLLTIQFSIAQSITLSPSTPGSPTKGTVVFDNATNLLKYWNGTAWIPITNAAAGTGWALNGTHIYNGNAGNVGIGTTTPKATFNVGAGKTVLFGADTTGLGNKFIWYPSKGALRAGGSYTHPYTYSDYANVGEYSIGFGVKTRASGLASTAIGYSTYASGDVSTALGIATRASGDYSMAMGYSSYAQGQSSTVMGNSTTASGFVSTAMGWASTASGDYSTAMGFGTIASSKYSTAMGIYNLENTNALLMIGNGTEYNHNNAMTVLNNGYVGIGTTDPSAPLEITNSASLNGTNNHYFSWATGTTIDPLPNGFHNIGVLVTADIVTRNSFVSSQSVTTSDARVKNIIGVSDNQRDLALLQKIQITNYRYKDVANRGSQIFKKVIAQQVEEVYPEAVKKITSVIPDIYSVAEKVDYVTTTKILNITLLKDYGIKAGDKIQLVHPTRGEQLAVVESVSGNSFTIKDWPYNTDKIFVYGREVNDFRTVDYEALSMLGISAIQQLSKEVEELKKENNALKADFMARLEALESRVSKEQPK